MLLAASHSGYSSTCHERTPSGPGISVRTRQVAAHQRQGRRSGYESGGDGLHVNPERSFGGTNGEPPSEASQLRKGGPGVLPRKI